MKSTPEGHGGTIPGDLGPAIERTKTWGPLDERRKLRELQERTTRGGGYRFWTGPDGRRNCEIDPDVKGTP